jgi:NAD(P)-dependent dehydrogenase (short-subunit alcohol dehydrogenase family)
MFEGRFVGRVAVITGGASGSGKAVAERIVAEGGDVVLWDVDPDNLVRAQNETGARHIERVDVTDPKAVAAAAAATSATLGHIDLLLCSAGITGPTAPLQDYPLDGWRQVLDINLNGVFHCCRAIIPHMPESGYGRIVNLASIAASGRHGGAPRGQTLSLADARTSLGVLANRLRNARLNWLWSGNPKISATAPIGACDPDDSSA